VDLSLEAGEYSAMEKDSEIVEVDKYLPQVAYYHWRHQFRYSFIC